MLDKIDGRVPATDGMTQPNIDPKTITAQSGTAASNGGANGTPGAPGTGNQGGPPGNSGNGTSNGSNSSLPSNPIGSLQEYW